MVHPLLSARERESPARGKDGPRAPDDVACSVDGIVAELERGGKGAWSETGGAARRAGAVPGQ